MESLIPENGIFGNYDSPQCSNSPSGHSTVLNECLLNGRNPNRIIRSDQNSIPKKNLVARKSSPWLGANWIQTTKGGFGGETRKFGKWTHERRIPEGRAPRAPPFCETRGTGPRLMENSPWTICVVTCVVTSSSLPISDNAPQYHSGTSGRQEIPGNTDEHYLSVSLALLGCRSVQLGFKI
jgi:hypothetical protein